MWYPYFDTFGSITTQLGCYLDVFQISLGKSKSSKKAAAIPTTHTVIQAYSIRRLPQSANTSVVNLELSFSPTRVSTTLDLHDPPNSPPPSPTSSATCITDHYSSAPREYESSLYHVCVWSSGCAVWTPPVYDTQPPAENMMLLCITVLYFRKYTWIMWYLLTHRSSVCLFEVGAKTSDYLL